MITVPGEGFAFQIAATLPDNGLEFTVWKGDDGRHFGPPEIHVKRKKPTGNRIGTFGALRLRLSLEVWREKSIFPSHSRWLPGQDSNLRPKD
jgi:hypothetical protein